MTEYFTWGIVLQKTPIGEADNEYDIFTWNNGKIRARALSSRKITSRLAGHLEPGTLSLIRIIRKNESGKFKIIEALSEFKTKSSIVIKILAFASELTPLEQADINMFSALKEIIINEVKSEAKTYAKLLKISGFDPKGAKCGICGSNSIACFSLKSIMFICPSCLKTTKN